MSEQFFSLVPFPAADVPAITMTGHIARQDFLLVLQYSVAGELQQIYLPPVTKNSGRKDDLWKTTCFEFFLAIKGQPQYWEFNLSPSGHWNVYHMDAYRRVGFREDLSIHALSIEIRKTADGLDLNATVDLDSIVSKHQPLEIGITAVLQTKDGKETHWALTHPATQADFHLRESFILELVEQNHLLRQSSPGA